MVAAATGTVSFVFGESDPEDVDAGRGYGNQVKVSHEGGCYTFYAHLRSVVVKPGDKVGSGGVLGTMGRTGRAGRRHLHFSLHCDAKMANAIGGTETIPIERLTTLDVTRGDQQFSAMPGASLTLDYSQQFRGHLYASNNGDASNTGADKMVLARIEREAQVVQAALDLDLRLAALAQQKPAPERAARELDAIVAIDAQHPVAHYLRATMVELPSARWSAAATSLNRAAEHNRADRRFVPWLPGRVHFQLGRIASAEQKHDEARRHFKRAIALSVSSKQGLDARRELEALP